MLARVPRNGAKKYSVDDLVAALCEAADAVPGILSTGSYDTFVEAHPTLPDGRPRPGKQAMMLRHRVVDRRVAAGLACPRTPTRGRTRSSAKLTAVRAPSSSRWRQMGVPTAAAYEIWQRSQPGAAERRHCQEAAGWCLESVVAASVAACPWRAARPGRRGCQCS